MLNYKTKFFLLCSTFLSLGLQADTITLFEGENLDGWKGDPKFWSVQDGAITGKTTAENPCKQTTYLTYTKKQFANFELTVSFRFLSEKGNGGIQYRSQWQDEKLFKIKGYQADMEAGKKYSGILYEQGGRGIVAKRGQKLHIDAKGKKTVKPLSPNEAEKAQASMKRGKWNTYRIVADGNLLIHQINGFTTVEVEDNDKNRSAAKGLLALQLHQGPPMTVQYKDIKILEIDESKPVEKKTKEDVLTVKNDFNVEKIHTVDKKTDGSWVSMCFDDKGNLFVCDQYGSLYKITLKEGKVATKTEVKSAGHAQGLCWAHGSLYVVSSNKKKKPGIHRLTDTNSDGAFDKQELILEIVGGGEHGTHGLIKDPKGDGLYFVVGNHTLPPNDATSVDKKNWAEDTLHPHLNDASGHAVGKKAPAGTLIWLSPDGKSRKVISTGMRNTYDIAASPTGELFGYDSDMEYDIATPWYRPTRVYHYVLGADYGWRTGTAKWPEYYADSLGSVIDIGPGCPTGVVFGTGAKFPAKYQKSLFIADWTFGRIYALDLSERGTTYTAAKEVFVSGKPLPISDLVIGPDGAMYFLTGGRRLQSALYRVTYTGSESTALVPAATVSAAQVRLKRVQDSKDVSEIWKSIGDEDRTLRHAARVSLEQVPSEEWLKLYQAASDPQPIITASIALARKNADSKVIFTKLLEVDFDKLNEAMKLEYLRAVSLACIRTGKPADEVIAQLRQKFDRYPTASGLVNRELCRVLVYLDSNTVLPKTVMMMANSVVVKEDISSDLLEGNDRYSKRFKAMLMNQPDTQALHYALMLKNQKSGWNEVTVRGYYKWLAKAEAKSGGNSYKGFIKNIRKEAMTRLTDPKLIEIAKESSKVIKAVVPMFVARGPGRAWKHEDAVAAVADLSKADAANGKKMFQAVLCSRCHAHSGQWGGSGPELTQLANRFSKADILKAIIDPSEVISDQYKTTVLHLKDKSTQVGKIMKEDEGNVYLAPNPLDLQMQIPVLKSTIGKRSVSKSSSMMPSLINALNPDELRDLMLFLTGK
ncbi:MAG: putative heme-binding domain-containing protein [Cryomorphaceae bacterium]|jgi:putative heme-binding domain-containing protein